MSGDERNVSGVWYGRWSANDPFVYPNSFIAVLEEAVGAVDGSVSEPDPNGADPLQASVSGARTGAQIHWIKQYEGGRLSHAVYYAGTVNEHATEISGGWRLGQHSGGFAMRREKFSIEEMEEEREIVLTPGDFGLEAVTRYPLLAKFSLFNARVRARAGARTGTVCT